ncbi:MAG: ribbon-helix-helix protein, CopG family [Candidatus Levybacteria bacterium]|nr:ribbon-helix-helix protein, CopG family [Candidatus Levybacteria bacterium]
MQTQTVNIALPKDLLRKADEVAKMEYRNRSELIREALRMYLVKMERWGKIFEEGRKAARKSGITSEEQINDIVYEFRHGQKPR